MLVYRIALKRWSNELIASGNPARWNTKGNYIIYTASTRALACLENVVHRSGEGLNGNFKVIVISIPASMKHKEIKLSELPFGWHDFINYKDCQSIGDRWYREGKTAILKVPSAIVPKEFNFLLNTRHKDFPKIKLVETEDFLFDSRLK